MRVVVTRPLQDAAPWVAALSARGHEAVALPLIDICDVADAEAKTALAQAWAALAAGHFSAVMFSSGNAVERFFASRPPAAQWPAGTRAWSPGPGTAEALGAHGVAAAQVDAPAAGAAQFDSEHLWQVVAPQIRAGSHVLCVRGGDAQGRAAGREWLAAQVREAGAGWEDVVAYRRLRPQWDAPACAQARALAGPGTTWLFSSSEAIANLQALVPGQSWRGSRAIATHPRIAQAAGDAGFSPVLLSQPALSAVLASIESPQ
ncbi:MAG: uroporphyrinogen-III synthase [Variovorax sp.]|nr:MAG: uroporphyrinogen-III synthase [Variovorax sp.]